jgi:outer membrane protein OmpA-like peptidoglycan-associated protein
MTTLRHTSLLISSAITLVINAGAVAQDANSSIENGQATYIDGNVQSADVIIAALKPKPKYKTRGIRFNNATPTEPVAPPKIAMGITFAYDSDQLSEQAITQLKPLGEALNSDQLLAFSFKVDGHTDATGSENYNLDLSRRRALRVGQHLHQAYGVKVDRLALNGKGETELYNPQKPADGINRRVEITTLIK